MEILSLVLSTAGIVPFVCASLLKGDEIKKNCFVCLREVFCLAQAIWLPNQVQMVRFQPI